MTNKYHNMSSAQLRSRLERLLGDVENNLFDICVILLEQYSRGELSPDMRVGVFRWFPQVARGELHPLSVLTFDASDRRLKSLIGLPLAEQKRLCCGGMVTVAAVGKDGKIKAEDRPLFELSARDFDTVFDAGRVRTFAEQKAIVAKREAPKPPTANRSAVPLNIRADVRQQEIVVGQLRIKLSELAIPLSQLGFDLVRKVKKAA